MSCHFTVTHLFHLNAVYLASRLGVTDKWLSSKVINGHINSVPFSGLLKSLVAKLDTTCVTVGRFIGVNVNGQAAPLRLGNCKFTRARQRML